MKIIDEVFRVLMIIVGGVMLLGVLMIGLGVVGGEIGFIVG